MIHAASTRQLWCDTLIRISAPVFNHMSAGKLGKQIPSARLPKCARYAAMEAFCRSFAGVAPWLAAKGLPKNEEQERRKILSLIQQSLDHAANPKSADFLDFGGGGQALVEAAYLALGLLRSDPLVWNSLSAKTRQGLVRSLQATRVHKPNFSNWLLFAATVEACLCHLGETYDPMRLDYAIRQHEQWYLGDGAYGDGPYFHWDYYNGYVIQPMLLECLSAVGGAKNCADLHKFHEPMRQRARRYAEIQERLIAPDGTFPPLGRSITYRFGAFQLLSLLAWRQDLPDTLPPAQVRCALTAVMQQTMLAPGTVGKDGWLTIGLHGEQPALGDYYNSTGSPYLALCSFLPLGLSPKAKFWKDADCNWTAKKIWGGQNHAGDHCLEDAPNRCLHMI